MATNNLKFSKACKRRNNPNLINLIKQKTIASMLGGNNRPQHTDRNSFLLRIYLFFNFVIKILIYSKIPLNLEWVWCERILIKQ